MKRNILSTTVLAFLVAVSVASAQMPPPEVTLKSVAAGEDLQEAVKKSTNLFLPAGRYPVKEPLIVDGWKSGVIVGAGRGRNGTFLEFSRGGGLRIRNCGEVTLVNLSFFMSDSGLDDANVEIGGDQPGTIRLINCTFNNGLNGQAVTEDKPAGANLRVRAPARVFVQGGHLSQAKLGLLVDHPAAEVTVLGGNFQNEILHFRQLAGALRVYGGSFQQAWGGADIELNAAAKQPFVFAACRSEGPGGLLRAPDTAEKIDVTVKACGIVSVGGGKAPFARYGAAGTLALIGNNLRQMPGGGIAAAGSQGTIWSLGNCFGRYNEVGDPYQLGATTKAFAAGDQWLVFKKDQPDAPPYNALLTAKELAAKGRRVPANLRFLETGAALPSLPAEPPLVSIPMPVIANIADLIPSVKQFGAKGDGQTDDTESLQRALDANRHGSLYFPAGAYRLTKPLFIDHRYGGWLVGAGKDKTLLTNPTGGGVVRTDGCGYATFQDLSFVAAEGAKEPVFNLGWKGDSSPAGFSGAALQANFFYRCRFVGGEAGLSIGTDGLMGSESLLVGCEFLRCGTGLAVRCYNALCNNAVDCLFQNNALAAAQADPWIPPADAAPKGSPKNTLVGSPAAAGSFNLFNSRLEGSQQADLVLKNSAADCFYVLNTTSTSPVLLLTGHTGAAINTLLEGFRYLGPTPMKPKRVVYAAGGSVIFLHSNLGEADIAAGGGIADSSLIAVDTAFRAVGVEGRARRFVFRSTGGQAPDRKGVENLFDDGDFESQTQAPCQNAATADKEQKAHLYKGNPAQEDPAHKGQYCLALDLKSDTAVFSFLRPTDVDASKIYRLSVSFFIASETTALCTGYAYKQSQMGGPLMGKKGQAWTYGLNARGPMAEWQTLETTLGPEDSSADFTWPPETEQIGMNVYLGGGKGTVYLDDITIEEMQAPLVK